MSDTEKYVTVTPENFATEVLNSETLVVVDFYAPWCGPCRVMNPIINKLANEFDGVIKVGKFNIDDGPDIATEYSIEAIPSILFFKNGQVLETLSGIVAHKKLTDKVNDFLSSPVSTS